MDKNFNVGDVVQVTKTDGKVYDCFIVEKFNNHKLFCGRVLESSSDHVPTTSWGRYGLKEDAIVQLDEDCKNIELISHPEKVQLEDANGAEVYRNTVPGTNKVLTFCVLPESSYGGWSADQSDQYITESMCDAVANSQLDLEEDV